jgi:hypothetical protein
MSWQSALSTWKRSLTSGLNGPLIGGHRAVIPGLSSPQMRQMNIVLPLGLTTRSGAQRDHLGLLSGSFGIDDHLNWDA